MAVMTKIPKIQLLQFATKSGKKGSITVVECSPKAIETAQMQGLLVLS